MKQTKNVETKWVHESIKFNKPLTLWINDDEKNNQFAKNTETKCYAISRFGCKQSNYRLNWTRNISLFIERESRNWTMLWISCDFPHFQAGFDENSTEIVNIIRMVVCNLRRFNWIVLINGAAVVCFVHGEGVRVSVCHGKMEHPLNLSLHSAHHTAV